MASINTILVDFEKEVVSKLHNTKTEVSTAFAAKQDKLVAKTDGGIIIATDGKTISVDPTVLDVTSQLANYAKKTDLNNYATTASVNTALANYTKTVDLPDFTKYATSANVYAKTETYSKTETDQKIAEAVTGGTVDLSDYVKRTELENYVTKTSLNTTLGSYVTATQLNAKGYAAASDVNTALAGKQASITSTSKLSASLVSGLATVATSGSYNDLTNKPTIPAAYTEPASIVKYGDATHNGSDYETVFRSMLKASIKLEKIESSYGADRYELKFDF